METHDKETRPPRPLVSRAFAALRGITVTAVIDGRANVWMREGASPETLTELSRMLQADLVVMPLTAEAFDALLVRLYPD